MATFKCKMCGGALEIPAGSTVAECEYCGTKQTLPNLDDEKRVNLYDRANHFRRNNEFDKATAIYEQILNDDGTDAEAYWSLVLCRYGIEYVKDPVSGKRVPTVNRAQFTSIFDDDNYKSAIKNADMHQQVIYTEEAKAINEIQKKILDISQKEEPFDVFICYKETDDNGTRTRDSVLANDIYHELTQENFKVFFSRITLEDKLGTAYEPYIFAALNSAKVMIVLGTKPEYFNAVWVKNEWSRFLALIKNGHKKVLIPAYKGMDPYNLPTEFSHLQAQNMDNLGFMQDLIRGIKKILGRDQVVAPITERVIINNEAHDIGPILRRAFLFAEDGEYDTADEYAEKVLDINPECAEAYVVKLLIERRLRKPSDLAGCKEPLVKSSNYQKAVRFATPEYKEVVVGYNTAIVKGIEEAKNASQYGDAIRKMSNGRFQEAIVIFQKLGDYKDSKQKVEECKKLEENERLDGIYKRACALVGNKAYDGAISLFESIKTFKDSEKKIEECRQLKETARKDAVYHQAVNRATAQNVSEKALEISIGELKSISGHRDADRKIEVFGKILEQKISARKATEEKIRVEAEEERREKEREAELQRIKEEKKKKRRRRFVKIGLPIIGFFIALGLAFYFFVLPPMLYDYATDLFESGEYDDAEGIYEFLGDYEESGKYRRVVSGIKDIDKGFIEVAIQDMLEAGVPVKISYNPDGGSFASAGSGSVVLVSSISATETPSEYIYYTAEEFVGLAIPTRAGYSFGSWTAESYNYQNGDVFEISLKAVWIGNSFTITYDLGNSATLENANPTEYRIDSETFTLVNPSRAGYTFLGWTSDDIKTPTSTITIEKGSTGNKSFKANWKANSYKITLDADGGSVSATTISATYDLSFNLPTPTKSGYKFEGWYKGDTKVISGIFKETTDISLKARWSSNDYKITFQDVVPGNSQITVKYDYNYSGSSSNTIKLSSGNVLNYPTPPTRSGYIFNGWYTDSKCTTRFNFTEKITDNTTLYAGWTSMATSAYNNYAILPYNYAASANYYYSSIYGSSSTNATNFYLVANEKGNHSIFYKNNASSSNYKFYITITNVTENKTILAQTLCGSTAYTNVAFDCNAGDVICISTYKQNSTTSAYFYFTGFSSVKSTATANIISNNFTYSSGAKYTLSVSYGDKVSLPALSRKGYSFLGWFNGDKKVESGAWNTAADVTLVPKWEAGGNTIILDASGGVVSSTSVAVKQGQQFTIPTPTKAGHTFLGWYLNDVKYVESGVWSNYDDITLVAKWSINSYKVTYKDVDNLNGKAVITYNYNYSGTTNSKVTVNNGSTLSYPSIPSRSGYIFTGWYTDSNCTKRYDFSGDVVADMTLYAGWKAMASSYNSRSNPAPYNYSSSSNYWNCYTSGTSSSYSNYCYLVANESGTHYIYYKNGSSSSSYATYFEITNLTTNKTIRSMSSVTNTSYNNVSFDCNAGDVIVIRLYKYSSSTYFYLYFTGFSAPTSTAKANVPTGVAYNSGASITNSFTYGSTLTLPSPTRVGYTFGGWYNGSTKVENGKWTSESDLTLTPKWIANSYKITLNADGGTVSSTTVNVTYGSSFTLPTPTKKGSAFLGWYSGSTKVTGGTWNTTSDMSLTAKWSTNAYTITYNDTYVSGSSVSYSSGSVYTTNYAYGETVTLITPTRTGYTFGGWYNGNTKVESGKWTSESNISLTAKWVANTYKITLDANGGTVSPTSITVTYGSTFTLPTPTWTGRAFSGWYNGNSKVESGTWLGLSDTTLKARWDTTQYSVTYKDITSSSNKVTITYDYNYSGASKTTTTVSNGSTLSYPSIPSRSGYVFTGWYLNSSCTSKYSFTGDISANMTLYAGWKAMTSNSYNYRYDIQSYAYSSSSWSCYTSSTSSSYPNYCYVVANESGTHYIYYKNDYSSSSYATYFEIKNVTTNKTIKSLSSCSNTSYSNVSFDCNAGDVIEIRFYRYSSSSYFYLDFSGFSAPTSTAKANIPNGYVYSSGTNKVDHFAYGDNVTLPVPSRVGYTFGGWYDGNTKVESGKFNYEKNITLTPKWTVNNYTITYDAAGGSVNPASATVAYGSSFTLPTPTRSGYTFDGWYIGGTKIVNGTWTYASNQTLTAKWTAKSGTVTYKDLVTAPTSVTVTYNYNYSGKSNSSTYLYNGNTLSYPSEPTRSGYVFTGWYTDSECKNRFYFGEKITGDITLYAGWKSMNQDCYSSTICDASNYNTNTKFVTYTANSTSSANNIYVLARESGLHKIYYMNSNSGTSYQYYITITNMTTGAVITNKETCADNTKYKNVSFICNEGDVICISIQRYSYSTSARFYFEGFNKVTSTSKCEIGAGNYIYSSGKDVTNNATYGSSVTLPTIYRPGYTFGGWYNGNTKVESGAWKYDIAVTLNAKWTAITNKITLNANGGTVSSSSVNATYGLSFTLPTPTRKGYTFLGWYDGNVKVTSGVWNRTGNVTLVAKWATGASTVTLKDTYIVPKKIYVTYNYNGNGSSDSVVSVSNNSILGYPGVPSRSGYVFTGWFTDSDCKTRYDFTGQVVKDMTLYAGWMKQNTGTYKTYNITNPGYYNSSSYSYGSTIYGDSAAHTDFYIVANETGSHTINYKNSSSDYYNTLYVSIKNMTTGSTILSNTGCQKTTYSTVTFNCNKGDVICISVYKFYNSSTLYFYLGGFTTPTSTAKCFIPNADTAYNSGSSCLLNAVKGETLTLPTPYRSGYTFDGWYNGTTKVSSGTWSYDENVTLTPKWK